MFLNCDLYLVHLAGELDGSEGGAGGHLWFSEEIETIGNWDNCVLWIMCTTAHVIYGEKYKCPKWTNTNPTYHTIQYRPIFSEIKWHMEILLYRCENGKGWSMTGCHMEISPMRCGLGKGWSMSETVARRSPAKPPFRPNPPTIGDQHNTSDQQILILFPKRK